MTTRVFVIDDHPMVRRGIRETLADSASFVVVGEAETGAEGLDAIRPACVDVVILDVSLPDANGLDLIRSILEARPMVSVLVMSTHNEADYALPALEEGAAGYLSKQTSPAVLIKTLTQISQGETVVPPSVGRQLLRMKRGETRTLDAESTVFTVRQLQILRLYGEGLSTSEIANRLCISESTVRTHRQRLMELTGADTVGSLVIYAVRKGIVVVP
ncbi:MAG: response regulator transcription factor [Bacteroidota bacterium]